MLYRHKKTGALARLVEFVHDAFRGVQTPLMRNVVTGRLHVIDNDTFKSDFVRVSDPTFDPVADIIEFHAKYGLQYEGKPRLLTDETQTFREKFILEEFEEYQIACEQAVVALRQKSLFDGDKDMVAENMAKALDALVDMVYVIMGTAVAFHGFDFREAWKRVHDANMAKVRANSAGDSKRGSSLDVVKPAGWRPPTMADLVADHAHTG